MKTKLLYIIFILLGLAKISQAQVNPAVDSTQVRPETANLKENSARDSIPSGFDPMATDSIVPVAQPPRISYKMSSDSLDAEVISSARDSMITDMVNQKIHLYGDATVDYKTINLKAAHIVLDWSTSIVTAEGMPDSTGRMANFPVFKDETQEFQAKKMRYNFQTEKGIVYDITTQQQDVIIHAARSKFISKPPKDSTEEKQDIIYSEDAIFTTCEADEPHFGVHSKKQKIIANKMVVSGPLNLELMGIPTPLWLPFGFFPVTEPRGTGLLFPEFDFSADQGMGLKGLGWFFPLGDHFNLSVRSNVYFFTGTWGVSAASQYRKKYRYNGSFNLGFDDRRVEEASDGSISSSKSFSIRWTHNQDRSAHPTMNFGGSVNFQINDYQSTVSNRADNVLNNSLSSNLNFSKSWRDKPFNFNASFSHSQNTSSKQITVNFPKLNFQTQTLYPFRKKQRSGKAKWYEDITFKYTSEAKSTFTGVDSTFFSNQTLDDARYGMKQNISSGTSFKLFQYFNFNPSVRYQEVWYGKSLLKEQFEIPEVDIDTSETGVITKDTLNYGYSLDTLVNGFRAYRTFDMSASVNTQIFGTLRFKRSRLMGLRHVIKPTLGFSYSPDYTANPNWFLEERDFSTPDEYRDDPYSIFDGNIYGAPSSSGMQMRFTYGFVNNFEAKYLSKRDSTAKKIKIFETINVGGSYNFASPQYKWSVVTASGRTRLFKGLTNFTFRLNWDPYLNQVNDEGTRRERVEVFYFQETGKLLQFTGGTFSLNSNLTVSKIRELFQGKEEEVVEDRRDTREESGEDDFLSLFENFRIAHNMTARWERTLADKDTLIISTNSIDVRGNIQLSKNWYITIGRIGYDFTNQRLTYPDIGFRRDIHCWEAGFNWTPDRQAFSFYIRAKGSTFGFLKLPYQRNYRDAERAKNAF
ncbi:MAG: LPS-assembly protein LptD [Bacteroidetes bacterium]|nr:MAG: LPS-assembly protein LptD [Bacteroidota bacterium]